MKEKKKWLVKNNVSLNLEKTYVVAHALINNTQSTDAKDKFTITNVSNYMTVFENR